MLRVNRDQAYECVERLVARYVEELVVKKNNFEKRAVERVRQDENLLRQFCRNDAGLSDKATDTLVAVLVHLRNVIEAYDPAPPTSSL